MQFRRAIGVLARFLTGHKRIGVIAKTKLIHVQQMVIEASESSQHILIALLLTFAIE